MCSNNSRRWNCSPQVSSVVIIRIELVSYTSRKIGRWLSSKGSKKQAYEVNIRTYMQIILLYVVSTIDNIIQ